MMRGVGFRIVALWLALSASLATPGAAVAHGFAHHELAEHAAHHAGGAAVAGHAAVIPDGHHSDHAHSFVDPGVLKRAASDFMALRTEQIAIASIPVVASAAATVPQANESPPDTPGLPPPRSRAPPAL